MSVDTNVGAQIATSVFGTPLLLPRRDKAHSDTAYNQTMARPAVDATGSLRMTAEGSRPTYRAVFNAFAADSTGTDIAYIQGAGAVDVQTINTGSATAGTFTLGFVAVGQNPITATTVSVQTTGNIPWNASADQVKKYLEALGAIGTGNVQCTGGPLPGTAVAVNFIGTLAGYQLPMILTKTLITGTWTSPITHTTAGFANQQTLTMTDCSTGTFTLSFTWAPPGQPPVTVTTAAIAATATTANIILAINAVMTQIPGNGTGTGFAVLTTPINAATNGPANTNACCWSFAGTIGQVSLNADQFAMSYDLGAITSSTPSATLTNVNARIIKIRRVELMTIGTTAAGGLFTVKRAAAIPVAGTAHVGQGVTSTALSFTPSDLAESVSVATCAYYTVHPTSIATAVSELISAQITQDLVSGAVANNLQYLWDYTNSNGAKQPMLRGNADLFVVNAAAALTAAGNAWNLTIEYSEDSFQS